MMITVLSWLVFVLFLLSVAHFLLENILAPSARMRLRYRIFDLRDQLREECESHSGRETEILQQQINVALDAMSELTISGVYEAKRFFRDNPADQQLAVERVQLVENSASQEVVRISMELQKQMRSVFLVNSAGWGVYLIPIVLAAMAISKVNRVIRRKLRTAICNVLNLPDRAFPIGSGKFLHA